MNEIYPDYNPSTIHDNYERVLERINLACQRSGRSAHSVKIVVVSKGQSAAVIQHAVNAGIRLFGENYPEETAQKIDAIANQNIEWHMIGHLQSRKVKIVVEHFHWFHALDSIRLAEKLNRALAERSKKLPVLLECNVGGEESKSGWLAADTKNWNQIADDVAMILEYPFLDVRGLMTMPPLETEAEQARKYFEKLRNLRDFLLQQIPHANFVELSMGTSLDYEMAVEEGATMVRIGTAILGPRPAR